jgi:hypothetical protein
MQRSRPSGHDRESHGGDVRISLNTRQPAKNYTHLQAIWQQAAALTNLFLRLKPIELAQVGKSA